MLESNRLLVTHQKKSKIQLQKQSDDIARNIHKLKDQIQSHREQMQQSRLKNMWCGLNLHKSNNKSVQTQTKRTNTHIKTERINDKKIWEEIENRLYQKIRQDKNIKKSSSSNDQNQEKKIVEKDENDGQKLLLKLSRQKTDPIQIYKKQNSRQQLAVAKSLQFSIKGESLILQTRQKDSAKTSEIGVNSVNSCFKRQFKMCHLDEIEVIPIKLNKKTVRQNLSFVKHESTHISKIQIEKKDQGIQSQKIPTRDHECQVRQHNTDSISGEHNTENNKSVHPISQQIQTDILTHSDVECQTLSTIFIHNEQKYQVLVNEKQHLERRKATLQEICLQILQKEADYKNFLSKLIQAQVQRDSKIKQLQEEIQLFGNISDSLFKKIIAYEGRQSGKNVEAIKYSQNVMYYSDNNAVNQGIERQEQKYLQQINLLKNQVQQTEDYYRIEMQKFEKFSQVLSLKFQELSEELIHERQDYSKHYEQCKNQADQNLKQQQSKWGQTCKSLEKENQKLITQIENLQARIERQAKQLQSQKSDNIQKIKGLTDQKQIIYNENKELRKINENIKSENSSLKYQNQNIKQKCMKNDQILTQNYKLKKQLEESLGKIKSISVKQESYLEQILEKQRQYKQLDERSKIQLNKSMTEKLHAQQERDKYYKRTFELEQEIKKLQATFQKEAQINQHSIQSLRKQLLKEYQENLKAFAQQIEEQKILIQKLEESKTDKIQSQKQFKREMPDKFLLNDKIQELSPKTYKSADEVGKLQNIPLLADENFQIDKDKIRKAKSQKSEQNQPISVQISPIIPQKGQRDFNFIPIEQLSEQNRQTVKIQQKSQKKQQSKSDNIYQQSYKDENDRKQSSSLYQINTNKIQQQIQTQKQQTEQNIHKNQGNKFKVIKVLSIEFDKSGSSNQIHKHLGGNSANSANINQAEKIKIDSEDILKKNQDFVNEQSSPPAPLFDMMNQTVPQVSTPAKSSAIEFQGSNSAFNADYNLNNIATTLSQENRKLKDQNKKLSAQKKNMQQNLQKISHRWKKLKDEKQKSDKLVQVSQLKEHIDIIIKNKQKMLKEFDHNDLQAFCFEIDKIIRETSQWVDLLNILTNENKKKKLTNETKIIKKKTDKTQNNEREFVRQKSVYSEGNQPKRCHWDFDISPFQGQFHDLHHQHQINSLQRLFNEDKDLSQISSVRHHSQNSNFLNSRSEIANIFNKDIVDEIAQTSKQKNFIKMPVNKDKDNKDIKNIPKPNQQNKIPLPNCGVTRNYQEKSAIQKRRLVNRTLQKMSRIQKKLQHNKAQFNELLCKVVAGYEAKIKKMHKQFRLTMNTVVNAQMSFPKDNRIQDLYPNDKAGKKNAIANLKRSRTNDSELKSQKYQELAKELENQTKENQKRQKLINSKIQMIADLEKKLKQEKVKAQKISKNYESQMVYSANLKKTIDKLQRDFAVFINKLAFKNITQKEEEHKGDKKINQLIENNKSRNFVHQEVQTQNNVAISVSNNQKSFTQKNITHHLELLVEPLLPESSKRLSERELPLSMSRRKSFSQISELQKDMIYKNIKRSIEQIAIQFQQTKQFMNNNSYNTNNSKNSDKLIECLSLIRHNILKDRKQAHEKNAQLCRRTAQIIKSFIKSYKISKQSFDKILTAKEAQSQSLKFIELRRNIQNFYEKNTDQFIFQSYEDKLDNVEKQLINKQEQIESKEEELRNLRGTVLQYAQLKRTLSQQSLTHNEDEAFYEFEEKSEFNNIKPLTQQITDLKKQLKIYKDKCQEYEKKKIPKRTEVIYKRH